jgi:hypothetical protein
MHFTGTTILRLQDGHIAEELGQEGALTAMQQLGLLRPPEPHVGAHWGGPPLPIGWNRMKGLAAHDSPFGPGRLPGRRRGGAAGRGGVGARAR